MSPDPQDDPAVAPSKPARPLRPAFGAREPRPEPIEADEAEIVEPNPGPDPEEVFPSAGPSIVEPQQTPASRSAVEALGETAATNAALNAGGAPTPLAGVPQVPGAGDYALEDDQPAFQPRLTGEAKRRDTSAYAGLEAGLAAHGGEANGDYVPTRFESDDAVAEEAVAAPAAPRRPGRAWPLVLIGLLTIGGIGYVAYQLLATPDPIAIPAAHVVSERPERALEPITVEDATPFLAALPTAPGLWALTAVETVPPAQVTGVDGRVAEAHVLTYGDGENEVGLRAYQFYSEDDAQEALTALAGDTPLEPHTVAGVEVGLEATLADREGSPVAWTHGSALFVASGAPSDVADLVHELGL